MATDKEERERKQIEDVERKQRGYGDRSSNEQTVSFDKPIPPEKPKK